MKPAEGQIFSVPLADGRCCLGVVARVGRAKILFGYFFPPPPLGPDATDLRTPSIKSAILVGRFSGLGLQKGRWSHVGFVEPWVRSEWPFPALVRRDSLVGRAVRVRYADDDPSHVISEEPAGVDDCQPSDSLMGVQFVEARLSRLAAIRD